MRSTPHRRLGRPSASTATIHRCWPSRLSRYPRSTSSKPATSSAANILLSTANRWIDTTSPSAAGLTKQAQPRSGWSESIHAACTGSAPRTRHFASSSAPMSAAAPPTPARIEPAHPTKSTAERPQMLRRVRLRSSGIAAWRTSPEVRLFAAVGAVTDAMGWSGRSADVTNVRVVLVPDRMSGGRGWAIDWVAA